MAEQVKVSGGIGFTGLLTITFIVLKLCEVIAWKWIWVLAPMWIPIGVLLFIGILIFCISFVYHYSKDKF